MNLDQYRLIKKLIAELQPAGRPGFDPNDTEAVKVAVAVKTRMLGDLPFEAAHEAILDHYLAGRGPWIDFGRHVRVPILRAAGCLAPTPAEAWDAVTRLVAEPTRYVEADLHPIVLAAYRSETVQGELVRGYSGTRSWRDGTWSRKAFVEIYETEATEHDMPVIKSNAEQAIAAALAAPRRPALAALGDAQLAIELPEARDARLMAEWEASLA